MSSDSNPKPILYITPGCPYALKMMIFLTDAGLKDHVTIVQDSPSNRALIGEKIGGARPSFPALVLPDRVITNPKEDEMVEYLAKLHDVDVSKLYLYNDYCNGVFSRYGKLMRNVISTVGGWPKVFPTLGIHNILLIGATGMVGSRIVHEAARRGHKVTRATRRTSDELVPFIDLKIDANDGAAVESALNGNDTIVCALGPPVRPGATGSPLVDTWKVITKAAKATGARVIFVGGAGSCLTPDGTRVIDLPGFPFGAPEFVKAEAGQHADALDWIRATSSEDAPSWTVVSPPKSIGPGVRTGKYDKSPDTVFGSISAEDFAVAVVDEIENQQHPNSRVSVGYHE